MSTTLPVNPLVRDFTLTKVVASVLFVPETAINRGVTCVNLRGKRPSRLFVEGTHQSKFSPGQRIAIQFRYGVITGISTPSAEMLWALASGVNAVAKYSTHWCENPNICQHWVHLFDRDMVGCPRERELALEPVVVNHGKATLHDIARVIVNLGGKAHLKALHDRNWAACYIRRNFDGSGMETRFFVITRLSDVKSEWLDMLVVTAFNKWRIGFDEPRGARSGTQTLREFLQTQGIVS